ncbi:MAG: ParB/RepB/Spo0J family partition protein [Hyphomicrobiaceae bacterium]
MTTPTTVPYSSLVASDAINARTKTTEALDELAASIAAKGLIQPLAVRPADAGASGKGAQCYEIIDGRRRHQAMALLVKRKTWGRNEPVPVLIRDEDDAEALETSLMANTARLPMHPVDQHEVFARLCVAPGGELSTAEIAARFGIAERTVRQHLALGRLAPEVRAAWRKGKIDAETARAFAVSPDQARQAEVLAKLGNRASDWSVRSELAPRRTRVDQSDELALIGEDAYLEAGGSIDEDLFSDARYVGDVALLKRLARERLEAECTRLTAAGWAWAEIEDDAEFVVWACDHVLGENEDDETDETHPFTAEQMAQSGCFVSIDDGAIRVQAGLIRPYSLASGDSAAGSRPPDAEDEDGYDDDGGEFADDVEDAPATARAAGSASAESLAPTNRLSGALIESLTTQQTIVAQRVLARDPELALKALLATWSADRGYGSSPVHATRDGYRDGTPLAAGSPPASRERQTFESNMAGDGETIDELAEALAPLIAAALDLRAYNPASPRTQADALVGAMFATDYLPAMREVFAAADYFSRVPKALCIDALEEMHDGGHHFGLMGRADLEAMKKAVLAQWAAEQAQACGWLPEMLRHPDYVLLVVPGDSASAEPTAGHVANPPSGRLGAGESEGASQ